MGGSGGDVWVEMSGTEADEAGRSERNNVRGRRCRPPLSQRPTTPPKKHPNRQVYKDFITGEEYYSDAKAIEPVLVDGVDTGIVRTPAYVQTAGGDKINVGGGGEFSKPEDDDTDDKAETKLDQFWNFPSIENEHRFASFKEFRDAALMPVMLAFKKLAITKGAAKDKDDLKEKGTRMATAGFKWVQTNFSSIQFFSLESTVVDGESAGGPAEDTYSASFAMLIDDGKQAFFYFFKDLYLESKF